MKPWGLISHFSSAVALSVCMTAFGAAAILRMEPELSADSSRAVALVTSSTVGNRDPTLSVPLDAETEVFWMISPLEIAAREGYEPSLSLARPVMESEDPVALGCLTRHGSSEVVGGPEESVSPLPA